MTRELVGYCGVDSGTILIIDPCYLNRIPELTDPDKWADACDMIYPKGKNDLPKEIFQGVMTNTRFGDGHFPVYVTKDAEGRVKKMEIVF